MVIRSLALEDFRNIDRQVVEFQEGINVIVGANAQGKTSLLEGVAYWSAARSFRTVHDEELIQFGKPHAWLSAQFISQGRQQKLEASLLRRRQRKITLNGVTLQTLRELVGILPSVLFAPSDLGLVQEGPALRRRLMDSVLCQIRPAYLSALSRYNKVLKQKQKVLRKQAPDIDLLAAYNTQLAKYAAVLIPERARFVKILSQLAQNYHEKLSNGKEVLTLAYRTVSCVEEKDIFNASQLETVLLDHFAKRLHQEIAAGFCLTGSQRDNFQLNINQNELRIFASQGQARTAVIAIKMAERAYFKKELNESPLLLLDDVLSELDEHRRRVVLNEVTDGQILITCCDNRRTRLLNGNVIRVRNGEFYQ
ncbi:MAG: DNA replication/repair protein RecF [Oscillospiraceae bacterium]|nr:DNA replication/repair protein RecF [Oscillospiraceae bacterium]